MTTLSSSRPARTSVIAGMEHVTVRAPTPAVKGGSWWRWRSGPREETRWSSRCSTRSRCPDPPPTATLAYQNAIEQAVLGKQAGFGSFWTVEHHFLDEYSHCSSPDALYGRIAAQTTTLRIGHGVRLLPSPYNHPIPRPRRPQWSTSCRDGRLEFGTGRSSTRAELEGFGADPDDSRGQWEEGLRHGRRRMDRGPVRVARCDLGRAAAQRAPEANPAAAPAAVGRVDQPRASHVLAGELGLGLLSFTIGVPPEELGERIKLLPRRASAAKPIGKFVNKRAATFTMVHCADTTEQAFAEARGVLRVVRAHRALAHRHRREWQRGQAARHLRLRRGPEGPRPQRPHVRLPRVVGRVHRRATRSGASRSPSRYAAADCDLLLCLLNPYKIPHRAVMRSIELLGEHVIPKLRS